MAKFESGIGGVDLLACCECSKAIRAWYLHARTRNDSHSGCYLDLDTKCDKLFLDLLKVYRLAVTKQVVKWTTWEVHLLALQSYR